MLDTAVRIVQAVAGSTARALKIQQWEFVLSMSVGALVYVLWHATAY